MEHHFWYDIDGNPIGAEQASALLHDIDARRIGLDQSGDYEVSTVHLVANHQFGDGPPLIFETMIFRDGEDRGCWRTATRHAALARHDQVCAALRNDDLSELYDEGPRRRRARQLNQMENPNRGMEHT